MGYREGLDMEDISTLLQKEDIDLRSYEQQMACSHQIVGSAKRNMLHIPSFQVPRKVLNCSIYPLPAEIDGFVVFLDYRSTVALLLSASKIPYAMNGGGEIKEFLCLGGDLHESNP
jgi:hypothetical protein